MIKEYYESKYDSIFIKQLESMELIDKIISDTYKRYDSYYLAYIFGYTDSNWSSTQSDIKPFLVGYLYPNGKLTNIEKLIQLYKKDPQINSINLIPQRTQRDAFIFSCNIFHDYEDQIYNDYHPSRPINAGWKCPRCNYKPPQPVLIQKIVVGEDDSNAFLNE